MTEVSMPVRDCSCRAKRFDFWLDKRAAGVWMVRGRGVALNYVFINAPAGHPWLACMAGRGWVAPGHGWPWLAWLAMAGHGWPWQRKESVAIDSG